jgi:hypothetical protein
LLAGLLLKGRADRDLKHSAKDAASGVLEVVSYAYHASEVNSPRSSSHDMDCNLVNDYDRFAGGGICSGTSHIDNQCRVRE